MVVSVLPCSQCCGGDRDVPGVLDGAGHVVGQVVSGLDTLAPLDHHHPAHRVPVLKCEVDIETLGLVTRNFNQRLISANKVKSRNTPGAPILSWM